MNITSLADIADLLQTLEFDDTPCGGAISIMQDGKLVLESAFGSANAYQAWTTHTLSVNFSIGKGVMATLIGALVSQGLLVYDKPICDYWPDFAQNDKQHIKLIDVLTHTADLFDVGDLLSDTAQLGDWQAMLQQVAALSQRSPSPRPPHPKDNTPYASAYSALVSGWILGGLVEKVSKQPLQDALDDYLAKPLGIQGQLYFGLPYDKHDKLAMPYRLFDKNNASERKKPTLKPDSDKMTALYHRLPISDEWLYAIKQNGADKLTTGTINQLYFDSHHINMTNYKRALLFDGKTPINYYDDDLLSVPIPAANGVSSSHALATLYAMHANGGIWQGKTIIDNQTMHALRQVRVHGRDAVMPMNMCWRAGFHRLFSIHHAPHAYGHMGYNGSVAFCDPNRRLSLAFIHNFDTTMLHDVRQFALVESVLKLIDQKLID